MYGLKLYVTFEDINNYIRNKVNPKYKDCTFIPIKAEINENDLSVDVTFISIDDIEDKNYYRYKIDLQSDKKTFERGLRAKANIIDEVCSPCSECAHEDWDMPQCKDCNAANDFKYFEGWENTK